MPKLTINLWFANKAEEAVPWYVSLFPNSHINTIMKYDAQMSAASGQPEGAVMLVSFALDGQPFLALNGGNQPWAQASGFVSFIINCKDQAEIDHYWNAFSEGGKPMPCGWITDKYGVTWQVVPENMGQLMADPVKGKAVAQAMLQMGKIIIADLEAAAK